MKRLLHTVAALLAILPLTAQNRVALKYDVNFEYDFNNREYDSGSEAYSESRTTNAARLSPSVGLSLRQSNTLSHSVMLGIDIFKEMGAHAGEQYAKSVENWDLFQEMTLWYGIEARLQRSVVKGWAGMFPRRFSVFGSPDFPLEEVPGRNVPSVFLSDWSRLYDNNLEGFLLTAARPKAYYELSLDWLGMQGRSRREQFKVHSYGKGRILGWLSAGWAAEAHHYANAIEYGHVMDNILLNPFIEFDLNKAIGSPLQGLAINAGWLGSIHRDRGQESDLGLSHGGLATLEVRNWNVGLRSETYFGGDLMPYFDSPAPEGGSYGRDLYAGNTFYRVQGVSEGHYSNGFYERLEAFWQPRIAGFLDLRVCAVFHCTGMGFQGWQQKLGLVFNLEKALRGEKKKASRSRQEWLKEPGIFERFYL